MKTKLKRNSDIIVVGNGGSILDKNKGWAIDNYNEVVRFNNYRIVGYEADVGTKTTIWFTCNCAERKIQADYKEIYFHSWQWDRNKVECYQKIKEVHPGLKQTRKKDVEYLKQQIPNYPHQCFSTGLIAIKILLERYSRIDLIGFDWHTGEYPHHYGDNEPRGHLHQPQLERDYLVKLNKQGKINFL